MKFNIEGMHCNSCEKLIENKISALDGVKYVKANYSKNTVNIEFDESIINIEQIKANLNEIGYPVNNIKSDPMQKTLGIIWGIAGLLLIFFFIKQYHQINIPAITENMGYGLIFLVGLLTGLHCISMCGGFVLSYTANDAKAGRKSYKSHILYAIGKTLSYTIIGALFGLLGSIIAFTPTIRGIAGILAGLFLIVFGLNMLNIFPSLRKLRFRGPTFINRIIGKGSKSPLYIGLLNGLMIACGPLQAIYIMAAGTGSMIEGAKILFLFAIGTLPVMLSFGMVATLLSKSATHKLLKASGVIVILLGLIMVNRGLALSGTGYDLNSIAASNSITGNAIKVQDDFQIINMDVTGAGFSPNKFVLKKGIPVKWVINGKELTGCNNAITVPKLNLEFDINPGTQTIEFTPTEEGTISWSCWMGMIPGTFIVKDDIDVTNEVAVQKEIAKVPNPQGGSCGGSCGSTTCNARTGGSCGCGA